MQDIFIPNFVYFQYLIEQKFGGQNFRHLLKFSALLSDFCLTFALCLRTKLSADKRFRHSVKFSAVLSAEFLSDKVYSKGKQLFSTSVLHVCLICIINSLALPIVVPTVVLLKFKEKLYIRNDLYLKPPVY